MGKVVTGQGLPHHGDWVVAILEAPDMPIEAAVDPLLYVLEAGNKAVLPHLAGVEVGARLTLLFHHGGILMILVLRQNW